MTGETKHTPGPWSAEPRDYDDTWNIHDVDGAPLASVPNPFEHLGDRPDLVDAARDETEANARLIASAPELFEALKALTEWVDWYFDPEPSVRAGPHSDELVIAARAALAKATSTPA